MEVSAAVDTAGTGPVPTAEAPPAPSPSTSAGSAPTTPKVAASPAESHEEEQEAAPAFDWDAWDGTVDGLPEDSRELGGKIYGRFEGNLNDLTAERDRLQGWYDALDLGEDPRIGELQASIADWESKYQDLEGKHNEFVSKFEAQQEADGEAYLSWFKDAYKDIYASQEARTQLSELLEQGWYGVLAAELIKMGPEAVEIGKRAKERGATDEIALEMVQLQLGASKPAPNSSARLVTGSQPAARPNRAEKGIDSAINMKDRRLIAAASAFKKHGIRS